MSFIKNQKGFTLLEMLIVVAIIGVLVLIFAPSFNVFNKADGTALNGKAKSIETAVFTYEVENDAYPVGPVLTTFAADFDGAEADMLALLGDLGLSTVVTDGPTLDNFISTYVYSLDPAEVSKYVKGSNATIGDFYVIDSYGAPEPEFKALDGSILSREIVTDSDGNVYNGTFKYTP